MKLLLAQIGSKSYSMEIYDQAERVAAETLVCPADNSENETARSVSRSSMGAAAVLGLGCLLLLIGLMVYAVPLADDYCRGLLGWRNALSFADYQYVKWTGRWTSMALECFLFSAVDLFRLVPIVLIALFAMRFVAVWQLLRATMRVGSTLAFCWSVLFLSVWISISPGVAEGELWATGAVEYQLPVTLALFAIALIVRSRWLLAVPFLIVAATMNELVAMALTGVCVNLLWMQRRNKVVAPALISLTVVSALLTGVVLGAPGNTRRAKIEHSETHNLSAMKATASVEAATVARWADAEALGLLVLLACAPTALQTPRPAFVDVIGWPLFVGGLLASGVLIPYSAIPGRVWDILSFALLLFLFYGILWLKPWLGSHEKLMPLGVVLIFVGLLSSHNMHNMVRSVRLAPSWRSALAQRLETHQFTRTQWPPSYKPDDVTSDPRHWLNKCEAGYLHLTSVSCPSCAAPGQ